MLTWHLSFCFVDAKRSQDWSLKSNGIHATSSGDSNSLEKAWGTGNRYMKTLKMEIQIYRTLWILSMANQCYEFAK